MNIFFMPRGRTSQTGFTLLELLVVMTVIGILLTLGIGRYMQVVESTENARSGQNESKEVSYETDEESRWDG